MKNGNSMNPNSFNETEQLIGLMELREPSANLDSVIKDLVEGRVAETGSVSPKTGRFGWSALVATALAASLLGVLVGQFVSPVASRTALIEKDGSGQTKAATSLTSVRFNVSAFNLMHGHSKQAQYADCDACHVSKWEMFEDWFYGDKEFFEQHDFGDKAKVGLFNCVACHVVQPASGDGEGLPAPNAGPAVDHSAGGDCFDCHRKGAGGFEFGKSEIAPSPSLSRSQILNPDLILHFITRVYAGRRSAADRERSQFVTAGV